MKPELIVMLTYKDKTVENALELFDEMKNTPVRHWGFKDVGLPPEKMKKVVDSMNAAGKTTFLEVVSLTEAEGLQGATLAVECGFHILMGTVFFDSINDFLKDKPVKYYPFPGHVHSHPSILDGTLDEIIQHARDMEAKGVDGMDLLTYRYTGDAPTLLKEVVKATSVPIVSAGSIDSYNRIAEVRDSGAWGFTIGTAFFEKKFIPNGSFTENMMAVWEWVQKNGRPD
jgi:hypothetical protein